MKLFQYAVILVPKKQENKDQEKPKLIVPIKDVIAADIGAATMLAARAIPEEFADRLDECEVAVRPF